MEIERIKKILPSVKYLGLADGAKDNWVFLSTYTTVSILDFFHTTEYLALVSAVLYQWFVNKSSGQLSVTI